MSGLKAPFVLVHWHNQAAWNRVTSILAVAEQVASSHSPFVSQPAALSKTLIGVA
jgi:hypothetical protein